MAFRDHRVTWHKSVTWRDLLIVAKFRNVVTRRRANPPQSFGRWPIFHFTIKFRFPYQPSMV